MENAVKALEMAAGVLLGVILMAAVAYFFTQISTWPENEDDLASSEQLAKFNQEYEVYNKSKMYGVDVLSCLNKVISNNSKYAQGGAFLGGNASLGDLKQRENYWINIKLKLKTDLEECLIVYYCNTANRIVERSWEPTGEAVYVRDIPKFSNAITKVRGKDSDTHYTNFTTDMPIKGSMYKETTGLPVSSLTVDIFGNSSNYKDPDGFVSLIYKDSNGDVSDMNPDITNLLNRIQTLSNNESSSNLTYVVSNKDKNTYTIWTSIEWRTVLYDLKNRKFTCKDMTYNTTTGRVNEIVFEEI